MHPPVPELVVSIATPKPDDETKLSFNPSDANMGHDDHDVTPPDDNATVEHAPASGKAATKVFKFPKDMSEDEKQYVRAVQKFFKYSEATVNDQRVNHKWPIRYMYDSLGQYEETCPKEVKKLRRLDLEQLEQLLSRVNWAAADDIKYEKNNEGVGEMHLLSVSHKEAYPHPKDLPPGLVFKLKTIIKNAEFELGKQANRKQGERDYCVLEHQREILAREGSIWGWAPGQSFWESRVRPHGYHGLQIEEYQTNKVSEEYITWTPEFKDRIFTQSEWGSVAWTVPSWSQGQ
jgi:hypothetical protein